MQTPKFNPRLTVMTIIVVLIVVVLIGRMGYLQVIKGEYYHQLADGNRMRVIPSMATRGVILDRQGVAMVTNRPGFAVSVVTMGKPVPEETILKLSTILGMPDEDIRKKLKIPAGPFEPIRIKADVGPDIVTHIEEKRADLPGVFIEVQPIRTYVDNELAAHVFGYVNEINEEELKAKKAEGYKQGDIIGKFGLERVYDRELRGQDGGVRVEVDVTGKPMQTIGKKDPIPGKNLHLTLDINIQKAAEEAVDEQLRYLQSQRGTGNAKAAAVVVMNPNTGEILAMVSKPSFNPNLFAGGISNKDWNVLNNNPFHPMDNKAISGEYPPGSTFKIVTGLAALELGKVTPEEKIFDSGSHWLVPEKGNAEGEALGWINFKEALTKSDNVYFYEMGNRLGVDNIEKFSRMFGLGAHTGIKLPGESDGLVASRQYKRRVYNDDWYLAETFDAAIGQGFQLATPLQMASVMSQIANGGKRYRPYLVSSIVSYDGQEVQNFGPEEMGRLTVNPRNMQLVREALREVARESGTAGEVFRNFPISIAGKTGTAENSHGQDHGWFVAYAPYDNPKIVIAVIVEQGSFGSMSAVPIARKIIEAALGLNKPA